MHPSKAIIKSKVGNVIIDEKIRQLIERSAILEKEQTDKQLLYIFFCKAIKRQRTYLVGIKQATSESEMDILTCKYHFLRQNIDFYFRIFDMFLYSFILCTLFLICLILLFVQTLLNYINSDIQVVFLSKFLKIKCILELAHVYNLVSVS